MDVSVGDEINQITSQKPHLVILGAGASYAALPNGDKNGKKLPLMNNLIEVLHLDPLIESANLSVRSKNFEELYDAICKIPELGALRDEIETRVYGYFQDLELPDTPTVYDHLVLSLRNKDFIATFNWDPLLVQALRRNGARFKLPRPLFLHGNVAVAHCLGGHMMGNIGEACRHCHAQLSPTKLLYPISEKSYHLDTFISRQWATLSDVMHHSFMVTIFGYGAPASDAAAIALLDHAWGGVDKRVLEEVEIIDVRSEDDLRGAWSRFIHSHHYRVENDFYNSWIANHPRRTGEAYWNQFMDAKFIENNPLPKESNFPELWEWYSRLFAAEELVTS